MVRITMHRIYTEYTTTIRRPQLSGVLTVHSVPDGDGADAAVHSMSLITGVPRGLRCLRFHGHRGGFA
ncbi:MAG: hypothetical protein ACT4P6_09330 [Gemmatimonadaceae bacterium]